MTVNHWRKALRHLHGVLAPLGGDSLTDGQLLARFVATREQAAFAALVSRHGPMVFGVCRRLLRHHQDAEDAFQATFLVLARKAASLTNGQAVGSWLYRVCYRIALEAKAINDKRRRRERQVGEMPQPEFMPAETQDWRPWLDQELHLLPESYRAVIVACDLEGRSRKEAARLLGLAEGTVSSRLTRGRCLLAKRLSRYGLSLSGGALAVTMSQAASAAVPASLLSGTSQTAVLVAAGEFTAVSTSVSVLVKGAFQTMLMAKLKLAIGAVVVVVALGASGLVYRASGQSAPAETERKVDKKPRSELEALRHENELLKLNLQVVLEKVRAQEAELRALRGRAGAKGKPSGATGPQPSTPMPPLPPGVPPALQPVEPPDPLVPTTPALPSQPRAPTLPGSGSLRKGGPSVSPLRGRTARSDMVQQVEDALEALREARDPEAKQQAADRLDKALKKLREQLKKEDVPPRE